jgi:hypothetical protein
MKTGISGRINVERKPQYLISYLGYADNWVVITSSKASLLAKNRLIKATDSISKWAEENGFEISLGTLAICRVAWSPHTTRNARKGYG